MSYQQAASNLANMPKSKNKKDNMKYASWAADKIAEKYQVDIIYIDHKGKNKRVANKSIVASCNRIDKQCELQ